MTIEQWNLMQRERRSAGTWFRRAARRLVGTHARATVDEQRWCVGYEAMRLLTDVLSDAEEQLVPLLAFDQFEEVERLAKSLAASLRRHRLAGLLHETRGRTPEEVALFRRKAQELLT